MKTRLWLNIALAVIVAILVAVVYFKPGSKKPAPPVLLTNLKAAEIHDIKIAQPDTAMVELVRQGDAWEMTAPSSMPADPYLVQSLLNSINTVVKNSFTVHRSDLSKYGLDPARAQLWLNGTEFDFGDTEPLNHYRYVSSDGQVHLVSGLLFYRIDHRAYWWASKRLLPENAQITTIQLPDATLTRKSGKWQLAPANPAISADAIQTLIQNWQNVQAIGTDKIGIGKSEGEVAIELTDAKPTLRFMILNDPDFLVLARPDLGVQYDLDSSQRGALLTLKSTSTTPKSATIAKPAAAHKPPLHSLH